MRGRYLNVMISRLPCGGLHLRRYPMLDGQTFSQSRVFKKAAAEGPIFSDYRSTKHVRSPLALAPASFLFAPNASPRHVKRARERWADCARRVGVEHR